MGELSSWMKSESVGPAQLLRAIVGVDRGGRGVSRRTLYNFIKADTGGTRTLALVIKASEMLHHKAEATCPLEYHQFDQWSGWVRPLPPPIQVSGLVTLDPGRYRPGALMWMPDGVVEPATPAPSEPTAERQQPNQTVGSHGPGASHDSSATSVLADGETEGT